MNKADVILFLREKLNFSNKSIEKLDIFHDTLVKANLKHNLIAKSTIKSIWFRHILDSAQLLKHMKLAQNLIISDLGTGAGFPGLILAIYGESIPFHVKLYEKSPVKRAFLDEICVLLNLKNTEILDNVYKSKLKSDIFVCRAFKKFDEILKISRENIKGKHKFLILKGKNAEKEIKEVSLKINYRYRLVKSLTDTESKIIMMDNINNDI